MIVDTSATGEIIGWFVQLMPDASKRIVSSTLDPGGMDLDSGTVSTGGGASAEVSDDPGTWTQLY